MDGMTFDLIKAVFLFAMVLVVGWLTTRLVGGRFAASGQGRLVRVLEQVPAGKDRGILLIEVAGQLHLVGSTAEQIQLLTSITDPEAVRAVLARATIAAESPGALIPARFRELFARLQAQAAAASRMETSAPVSLDESTDAEARVLQQLKRLKAWQR
jgi:flagellar biogenesis protein FliO